VADGAHGELTRQRHHLFRRSTQKAPHPMRSGRGASRHIHGGRNTRAGCNTMTPHRHAVNYQSMNIVKVSRPSATKGRRVAPAARNQGRDLAEDRDVIAPAAMAPRSAGRGRTALPTGSAATSLSRTSHAGIRSRAYRRQTLKRRFGPGGRSNALTRTSAVTSVMGVDVALRWALDPSRCRRTRRAWRSREARPDPDPVPAWLRSPERIAKSIAVRSR
jgi:hypothetical protein